MSSLNDGTSAFRSTIEPAIEHIQKTLASKYDNVNSFFLMVQSNSGDRAWCAKGFLQDEFIRESEICLTPSPSASGAAQASDEVCPDATITVDEVTKTVVHELCNFVSASLTRNDSIIVSYALILRLRDGRRLWSGSGELRERLVSEREIVNSGEEEMFFAAPVAAPMGNERLSDRMKKKGKVVDILVAETAAKIANTIPHFISSDANKSISAASNYSKKDTVQRKQLEIYLRVELTKFKKLLTSRKRKKLEDDDDEEDSADEEDARCKSEMEVKPSVVDSKVKESFVINSNERKQIKMSSSGVLVKKEVGWTASDDAKGKGSESERVQTVKPEDKKWRFEGGNLQVVISNTGRSVDNDGVANKKTGNCLKDGGGDVTSHPFPSSNHRHITQRGSAATKHGRGIHIVHNFHNARRHNNSHNDRRHNNSHNDRQHNNSHNDRQHNNSHNLPGYNFPSRQQHVWSACTYDSEDEFGKVHFTEYGCVDSFNSGQSVSSMASRPTSHSPPISNNTCRNVKVRSRISRDPFP